VWEDVERVEGRTGGKGCGKHGGHVGWGIRGLDCTAQKVQGRQREGAHRMEGVAARRVRMVWREGMLGVVGVISRGARHRHASVSWRMSHGRTVPLSAHDLSMRLESEWLRIHGPHRFSVCRSPCSARDSRQAS